MAKGHRKPKSSKPGKRVTRVMREVGVGDQLVLTNGHVTVTIVVHKRRRKTMLELLGPRCVDIDHRKSGLTKPVGLVESRQ